MTGPALGRIRSRKEGNISRALYRKYKQEEINQMKKKLTAAVLTLCLVLGLLPMSALAATYKLTLEDGTEVGTIETNDETGAYEETALTGSFAHYSISPGTITVGDKTANLTAHYGEAPGTLTVTATLVETEEPFTAVTVTFQSGDGASGTMASIEVETKAEADAWTLPAPAFTAPADKVFAGWKLSTDTAEEPTLYEEGAAYPLTENVTFVAVWKATELKIENGALKVNGDALNDVEAGDTVSVAAGSTDEITVPQETLTALKNAQVAAVEVAQNTATVTVSVEDLRAGATLTIKAGTDTAAKVSVVVSLTGAPTAAQMKSGSVLNAALEIKIHNVPSITNPIYAYKDGNIFRRARVVNGSIFTRHLTEFVVLDGDNAAAAGSVQNEYLPVLSSNTSAAAFLAEGGDRYFAVYTKGGDVASLGNTANASADGSMVECAASLEGWTLNSVFTSPDSITLGGQYGLNFNTVAASSAFTTDSSESVD